MTEAQLADIANLWMADAVEQFSRVGPERTDFGRGLLRMRALLLPAARAAADACEAALRRTTSSSRRTPGTCPPAS